VSDAMRDIARTARRNKKTAGEICNRVARQTIFSGHQVSVAFRELDPDWYRISEDELLRRELRLLEIAGLASSANLDIAHVAAVARQPDRGAVRGE